MNNFTEEPPFSDIEDIKESSEKNKVSTSSIIDWMTEMLIGNLCCLAILGMALMICYDVFARYLFNSPTTWVTEYSLYIFVGTCFFAAANAHLNDSHVRVEILLDRLPEHSKSLFGKITAWLGFFFTLAATWQMILFVISEFRSGSSNWGLTTTPLWIPQTPVAVGLGIFALAILSEIHKLTPNLSKKLEMIGLALLVVLAATLVWIGAKPVRIADTPFDWGLVVIIITIFTMSLLWSGVKIAMATTGLMIAGGLLFYWAADLSSLAQGGLMALYLVVLMFIGVRIIFALGLVGLCGLLFLLPSPQLLVIGERAYGSANTFALTSIPMFVLMGTLLTRGGVSSQMFDTSLKWLGRFPGGIAHATVGACGIFAAVSGSSLATAATMGMTAAPEMIRNKYSPRMAYGVVAAGGTLGILIPPSIAMILYGSLVGIPITTMFMAGVVPGLLLMLAFMVVIYVWSVVKPSASPKGPHFTWSQKTAALSGVLPFVLLIAAMLGSLYFGVCTPTEAGAVSALLAAILCAAKKKLTFSVLKQSLLETAIVTSYLIMIVFAANVMTYTLDYIRLPKELVTIAQGASLSPGLMIICLVAIYVVLGMFIDPVSMIVMTWSIAVPVVTSLGFNSIWFGVILVMMIEIGLITPPVGLILFILRGMSGDIDLKEIVMGVLPFIAVFFAIVVLLYYFPDIVMWLPNLMGGAS